MKMCVDKIKYKSSGIIKTYKGFYCKEEKEYKCLLYWVYSCDIDGNKTGYKRFKKKKIITIDTLIELDVEEKNPCLLNVDSSSDED